MGVIKWNFFIASSRKYVFFNRSFSERGPPRMKEAGLSSQGLGKDSVACRPEDPAGNCEPEDDDPGARRRVWGRFGVRGKVRGLVF